MQQALSIYFYHNYGLRLIDEAPFRLLPWQ